MPLPKGEMTFSQWRTKQRQLAKLDPRDYEDNIVKMHAILKAKDWVEVQNEHAAVYRKRTRQKSS